MPMQTNSNRVTFNLGKMSILLLNTLINNYHYLVIHVSHKLLLLNCRTAVSPSSANFETQLIPELNVELCYSRFGMLGVGGV